MCAFSVGIWARYICLKAEFCNIKNTTNRSRAVRKQGCVTLCRVALVPLCSLASSSDIVSSCRPHLTCPTILPLAYLSTGARILLLDQLFGVKPVFNLSLQLWGCLVVQHLQLSVCAALSTMGGRGATIIQIISNNNNTWKELKPAREKRQAKS